MGRIACAVLAAFVAFAGWAEIRIPSEGAVIAVSGKEERAAKELKTHLDLIFGKDIPIVKESEMASARGYVFHVGTPAPGDGRGALKPEEGRFTVAAKEAWFWGDAAVDPKSMCKSGAETAVNVWLEDDLGVRWPWFDEIAFKASDPIVAPHAEGGWFPTVRLRAIRTRDQYVEWRARMRDGRHNVPTYGHAFSNYWMLYGKDHPEYFGMRRDGKRLPPGAPDDRGNPAIYTGKMSSVISMCVSCEALVDKCVETWAAKGAGPYINICENDATGENVCHCEKCCALDEPPPPGATNIWVNWYADRYVDFANRIVAKARKVRPDVQAAFYAYNATELAPRRVKAGPGLSVGVVPTVFTPEIIRDYLRSWKKVGFNEFFYRPNRGHYYTSYAIPLGNEEYFFNIFKVVMAENPIGFDYDSPAQSDVLNLFRDYVIYKGMQDPSKDFAYWENHYCEAFGPAKDDVKGFFRYWRQVWKDRLEPHVYEWTKVGFDFSRTFNERLGKLYLPEDFDRSEALLDAGLGRSGLSEGDLRRVRALKEALRHARLYYAAAVKKCDANAKALYEYRVSHGLMPIYYNESYRNDRCGVYEYLKKTDPAALEKLPKWVKNHAERRARRAAEAKAKRK